MDWTTEEELRLTMEVNFFAPTLLTSALVPLLHEFTVRQVEAVSGKGAGGVSGSELEKGPTPRSVLDALPYGRARVINITSVSARMAAPGMGPYTASKHALRGMSDALRWELDSHGVDVVQIEPGFHLTPIVTGGMTQLAKLFQRLPAAAQEAYGGLEAIEAGRQQMEQRMFAMSDPPQKVVDLLVETLSVRAPRARYVRTNWTTFALFSFYELTPTAVSDKLLRVLPGVFPRPSLVRPAGAFES